MLRPLASIGLDAIGIADGRRYEPLLPGCRSVVVIGSGGPTLWDAWVAELREHPERLAREPHPLDAFVARAIERVDPAPPPSRRWIRCAADEITPLDFRTLAVEAGLGWASRLGLVLHADFGPWLGLRAACLTTDELVVTGPKSEPAPCAACHAPCQTACHGSAITEAGWDVGRCARFHAESAACLATCDARLACPVGAAHRYSDLEMAYHYNRQLGRERLGDFLRIEDPGVGSGPYWDDWSR